MTYLLANTFEQVAAQLTEDECKALVESVNGVSASAIVPDVSLYESRLAGMIAWLGRTRQIANPYAAWEAHRTAWTADAAAWLAGGVSDADRRARLARGELLIDGDNSSRPNGRKVLLWAPAASPSSGWIQAAVLWWNSSGNPSLHSLPGGAPNVSNSNVATFGTLCAAAVNAGYAVGQRCLRIDGWPLFVKKTLSPGGEIVYYLRDGEGNGAWPGIWYSTWKAAVESTWRTWLTAYDAAGGKLDAIFLDAEYQLGRWWLANKSSYQIRGTVGGVAAGREFRVTLGSETFAITAPDSNAQTLCNLIQLAWNTLDPATSPNLTQMTCAHVAGTSRVLVTHKQMANGYGVPTALSFTATGGGTFSKSVEPISGYRYFPHPNYPTGTTWHADLKADSRLTDQYIDDTYLPTRARMNAIDTWPASSGADTYRFNEQVFVEFRKAIEEAIYEPLIEFFPNCHLFDYEGTGKCGGVLPSSDPGSPFGTPVGMGYSCGTHQSRNIYTGVNQGGNTRSDCYMPSASGGAGATVQQSRISEVRYTPSGAQTGDVYRATLAGFPAYGGVLTTTNLDFTVGATTTPYAVAQGMANAWNASVVGHVAQITATAVSTGGGNGYVKYTNDPGNQTCEEIVFSVTGSGGGTRTLQVSGAFVRVLDDWWIIQGMLAANTKPLALWILGASNATTGSWFSHYGPKWNKIINMLAYMMGDYCAFWNTGSSATSDALVEEAITEGIEHLEDTRGVPLVMPVRDYYDPDVPLVQDFLVNGRIKRFTLDKYGDYTVRAQPLLATIGNQLAEEGVELSFTAEATDTDEGDTLTFSGSGLPDGATIDDETGVFSWTPTSEQVGSHTFDVVVTDSFGLANRETITVAVSAGPPGNQPPVIEDIAPQNASEHVLFTYQVEASDENRPISYQLSGAPAGMTINGLGVISWTPNETHGGNVYTPTVIVSETGLVGEDDPPLLSSQKQFTITVAETNTAPVLGAITPKSGTEGTLISFQCSATDSDIPAQALTYSLPGSPPTGAEITSGGLFTWTPSESQAGNYNITIRVTDNGDTPLYHERVVAFTIADSNRPPVIEPIPPQSLTVGEPWSYTVEASDPDDDTLAYSIDDIGQIPVGLAIDDETGELSWTPSAEHAGGEYEITVRATDDGTPHLSSTASVSISVESVPVDPPSLSNMENWIAFTGHLFTLVISATGGAQPGNLEYQLLGMPVGDMAIGPQSGVFTWTPRRGNEGYTYPVCVQVSDGLLTDAVVFYISVRRPITIAPPGPVFGPMLFAGDDTTRPLRRPRGKR